MNNEYIHESEMGHTEMDHTEMDHTEMDHTEMDRAGVDYAVTPVTEPDGATLDDIINDAVDFTVTGVPSAAVPAPETSPWNAGRDAEPDLGPQIQNRMFTLSLRMERIERLLEQMAQNADISGSQLNALTRNLTDAQLMQPVYAHLADMSAQVESYQEQMDQLARALGTIAKQEQLDELARTLKRLNRTQFKSNVLGETKEERTEHALKTLQDVLDGRALVQERGEILEQQRREDIRRDARGEFAADFLPTLDGLEMALENGRELLARQRQSLDEGETAYGAWQRAMSEARQAAQMGVWRKLRRSMGAEDPADTPAPEQPLPSDFIREATDATQAWLDGLNLVYRRFLDLLAAEGVQEIRAQDQPFDPHQHVAVDTAVSTDNVSPNTVVDVVRKGYRQHGRVLRYAEVIVSQVANKGHEIQDE